MRSERCLVRRAAACAMVLSLMCGCTKYHAQPLDHEAVQHALQTPNDHAIRVSADQLHHPLLKPLPVQLSAGLSPEEAAVVAVIINPELRAERNQRGIASAQLLQAGLLPNPQLTGGLDFPYGASPPDNFTAYNVGLDWEITSLITRDAKRQSAAAEVASVDLDIAWKEWQVAQEARTAAYDVLGLEGQLRAARQADEQFRENLEVVRRAVERHQKTLLDLAAAEASALDAHAAVISQEKELAHQKLQLNRVMGLPPERAVLLRTGDELPSRLDAPRAEALLPELEKRRLDLLALKCGYESQDATLRAAVLAQFPKISLGFNAQRDNTNVSEVGFGVAIDIPLFDRNQGVIATETATRQKLFDEYAARVFAARSDVAMAIADISAINAQIVAAQAGIASLQKVVQTYQAALDQGNADVLSFYTAKGNLAQKQIDLVKLKQQLIDSWIALEIASGEYLPLPGRTVPATAPATMSAIGPATTESTGEAER